MLTGEYRNTLDEKGRLMIPSRMRAAISGEQLVITRGIDRCLYLFPPEIWHHFSHSILHLASPLSKRTRLIQRRIIAPAQDCPLDKNGRLHIPPALREAAQLQRECIILGLDKYLELWDATLHQQYLKDNDEEFEVAAEELGQQLGGLL